MANPFKTQDQYARALGEIQQQRVTSDDIRQVMATQNLNEVADLIHGINRQHGFWPELHPNERNFGEAVALMHSELSEALEEHRSGRPAYYVENGKPEGWATEMVDCMIRMLDFLGAHGVDINNILEEKTLYNNSRPYKHGREY